MIAKGLQSICLSRCCDGVPVMCQLVKSSPHLYDGFFYFFLVSSVGPVGGFGLWSRGSERVPLLQGGVVARCCRRSGRWVGAGNFRVHWMYALAGFLTHNSQQDRLAVGHSHIFV